MSFRPDRLKDQQRPFHGDDHGFLQELLPFPRRRVEKVQYKMRKQGFPFRHMADGFDDS